MIGEKGEKSENQSVLKFSYPCNKVEWESQKIIWENGQCKKPPNLVEN